MTYTIGDKVTVVKEVCGHNFNIGEVVDVAYLTPDKNGFGARGSDGKTWNMVNREVIPYQYVESVPENTMAALVGFVDKVMEDVPQAPDGGPAKYYDFPEEPKTLNDLIEFKDMGFHLGNIFKACWRYGTKVGVTKEYDARKIIYSGCRLLKRLVGTQELRDTLQRILDDPQFK